MSRLTSDIPGTGGTLKARPEDFLVEEIPAYEPCGEGEHIYLFIEKTNIATLQLVRMLSDHFGVRRDAIGFAGLKDKLAVTRQLFSVHVPGKKPEDFPALQAPNVVVHWVDRHTNKLRRGHLNGNRFIIRVRDAEPGRITYAAKALQILARRGVPNRIGPQRFGHLMNNHLVGRAMLRNDAQAVLDELLGPNPLATERHAEGRTLYRQGKFAEALELFPRALYSERRVLGALSRGATPANAARQIERVQASFYIAAWQSAIFNRVLDQRMADGTYDRLVSGDLAFKHDSGAVFAIGDSELADPETSRRLTAREISPSGPMWGPRMMRASGAIDEQELAALAETGVGLEHIERYGREVYDAEPGKRRPLRVKLSYPDVEAGMDEHGAYIKCVFELPRGSFATTVMDEVMKVEGVVEEEEGES